MHIFKSSHHLVKIVDGKIIKESKKNINDIKGVEYSIDFFKSKFNDLVPETKVIKTDNSYFIEQELIEGETLKNSNKYNYDELQILLNFINESIEILLNEGKYFDIVGYQGNNNFLKYKGIKKILKHYKTINNFFNSTNFVIDKNLTPYFVDNIASYGIYSNNNIFNKLYRFILLLGYKKQINKKMKKYSKK